jgi:chromosome segregation ATPase
VAPGATEKFEIEESHLDYVQYQLSNIDDQQVALLVQDGSLTPSAQDAVHRVLDQKNQVEVLQAQINSRQHEIDAITKDQARVRENMKALKGTAEEKALVQRYTRQLDQQEDRLNVLQKEISDLQAKHSQAQADLDQLIQSIALDEAK